MIALIGDGSFQNGLIYEALNSLGVLNTNVLIVLNDNGMSISPTVGCTHDVLEKLKTEKTLADAKLFERFGLTYRGVVNGNDFEELLPALEEAKSLLEKGSVLLHVATKKGQGYPFSENAPTETHGFSPKPASQKEYAAALGEELSALAAQDRRIAAVTAAMTDSLGLRSFFESYPDRAFDVGICEEHACVLAAALAAGGMKPYYAIYSTFLQRAFDEIIHDVCGQNLPVTFLIDRAGITGPDGETHQGIFDLSYLSLIPNLTVAVPKDIGELRAMVRMSAEFSSPLAIRYPRMGEEGEICPIEIGKFDILHSTTSDIIVYAAGETCVRIAHEVLKRAQAEGFSFTLVNARFIKPRDTQFVTGRKEKYIVTLEDNVLSGGLGDGIARLMRESESTVISFGYRDTFIPHGEIPSLAKKYGLDPDEIFDCLRELHARG